MSLCSVAADTWYLAKEDACFSATEFMTEYRFHAPKSGNLSAVEMYHTSGDVTCATSRSGTHWGCYTSGGDPTIFAVQMLRENEDGSEETVLPTANVEEITSIGDSYSCSNGHGCSVGSYYMDGYDVISDAITWSDAALAVATEDTFSLQYSEGCCGVSTSDNGGTSCADIYFQYEPFRLVSALSIYHID